MRISDWSSDVCSSDLGEVLRKAYDLMVGDGERLARIITLENGKSLADARAEVAYAAEFFRWNAEEAVRIVGQMSTAPSSGARILVNHKAAGVALLDRKSKRLNSSH